MVRSIITAQCALLGLVTGCGQPAPVSPCAGIDSVLASSSFIIVTTPLDGARTPSPIRVQGCSRTNESNVVWALRARDGRLLTSGFTSGGGFSGPAPFEFLAEYTVTIAEVGQLDVYAPDESEGEGFPPPKTSLPLVLVPRESGPDGRE